MEEATDGDDPRPTGLATLVKSKAAIAALATVLVVGGGAGATVAAANGAFGQQVKEQVQDCKDQLRAQGVCSIGPCVSTFTRQHRPHRPPQRHQHQP